MIEWVWWNARPTALHVPAARCDTCGLLVDTQDLRGGSGGGIVVTVEWRPEEGPMVTTLPLVFHKGYCDVVDQVVDNLAAAPGGFTLWHDLDDFVSQLQHNIGTLIEAGVGGLIVETPVVVDVERTALVAAACRSAGPRP